MATTSDVRVLSPFGVEHHASAIAAFFIAYACVVAFNFRVNAIPIRLSSACCLLAITFFVSRTH